MGTGSLGVALPFVVTLLLSACSERSGGQASSVSPNDATAAEPVAGFTLSADRKTATADLLRGDQVAELPAEVAELRIREFRGEPASLQALQSLPDLRLLHIGGEISDAHLTEVAGLESLRTLNLSRSAVTDNGLDELSRLTQLRLLRLNSPAVTDEGMNSIAGLQSLRGLHLVDVPIADRGIDILSQMTWLESFYLDGSRASDESLYRLIKAVPGLHFHRDQLHLPKDPNADP